MIDTAVIDRFWSYVNKQEGQGPNGDCWTWTKHIMHKGYGHFMIDKKPYRTHRLAWKFTYGDPGISHVLHKCDNRACCNPSHLFLGSNEDNKKDMMTKNRQAKGDQVAHRGIEHGMSKLSENEVLEIRTSSLSVKDICKKYKIGKTHAHRILKRESWKHI
jgi:hypothetical protein